MRVSAQVERLHSSQGLFDCKACESSASAGSWTTEAPWYGERQDLRKLPCLSQACLELSRANTENLTLEVALPPSTVLC